MTDLWRWTDDELAKHDTPPAEVRAEIERRERGRRSGQWPTKTPSTIQQLQEAYANVDRERNEAIKQRDDAVRGLALRSDELRTAWQDLANREALIEELKASNLQRSQRIAELEERAIKQAQQRATLPPPVGLYPLWNALTNEDRKAISDHRDRLLNYRPIHHAFADTFDYAMRTLRRRCSLSRSEPIATPEPKEEDKAT